MSKIAHQIKETATSVRTRIQRRSKPTLSFPLRSLSNVKYHPTKGFLELKGKKKVRTLTVGTVKTFAQTLRMMSQAKNLVEDDEIMTKREAYYVSKNWDDARFDEQPESDTVIDDIEALFQVNREQLGFIPEEKGGEVAGKLIVIDRDSDTGKRLAIDCTKFGSGAYSIPISVEHLKFETKAKFVLGVGGGRPIDVAKCASFESNIPFLSIPTAASHDGIVSSRASLIVDGKRKSLTAQTPLALIADTSIIAASPYKLLAAGCGDVIANITAVMDWKLAQRLKNEEFSSSASMLADITGKFMIENSDMIKPGLEESAWFVAKALVSSGVAMSIAGSSRPASGSEHKFSHALDEIAEKPALHGEQCGVGAIMMMYLQGGDWQKIREALLNIGAPTTAKGLGLSDDELI